MSTQHWKIDDLPWDQFDPALVDPNLIPIVKAAALVEYNASDYATYLCNVFADDPVFCQAAQEWAIEETQHGEALGLWAEKADPSFDFKTAFARYTTGYRINVEASASIRGSKSGELVARCVVETGTSSYYAALGNAVREPVLKKICRHIAADEVHHYKMFYAFLEPQLKREKLSRVQRLKIALGRVAESEDDELSFAYFAANAPADAVYDRSTYTKAYQSRAYALYQTDHAEHIVTLVSRACGFKLSGKWRKPLGFIARHLIRASARRAESANRKAA